MPDGRFWINTARGYVLFDKERDYFITDVTGFMKNLESWGVPEQVFVDREGNTWLSVAGEGCYRYKEGGKRSIRTPVTEYGGHKWRNVVTESC